MAYPGSLPAGAAKQALSEHVDTTAALNLPGGAQGDGADTHPHVVCRMQCRLRRLKQRGQSEEALAEGRAREMGRPLASRQGPAGLVRCVLDVCASSWVWQNEPP